MLILIYFKVVVVFLLKCPVLTVLYLKDLTVTDVPKSNRQRNSSLLR